MSNEDLDQLNILEQNLSSIVSQKQQFNKQLLEIESALSELDSVKDAFKIVGTVMIKKSSDDLKKDLSERKSLINIRLESFDKQEKLLREQVHTLQEKVMRELDANQ